MARKLLVVKLGGSVITRAGAKPSVAAATLRKLGREIARSGLRVVIVHGTGAYGKPPAVKYGYLDGRVRPRSGVPVSAIKATLLGLHAAVVLELCRAGLQAVGCDPSCLLTVRHGRIVSAETAPLRRWLRAGMVPVLSGDMLVDAGGGFSVCSSDDMACALAAVLGAQKVVFVTDVDGVRGPVRRSPLDVSGGMAGKLRAARRLADKGIPSFLVNGLRTGRLRAALSGESVTGTAVEPREPLHEAEEVVG